MNKLEGTKSDAGPKNEICGVANAVVAKAGLTNGTFEIVTKLTHLKRSRPFLFKVVNISVKCVSIGL